MGGVWEAASFALRAAGSRDQQQVAYQTVSQILILLAPLCKSLSRIEAFIQGIMRTNI